MGHWGIAALAHWRIGALAHWRFGALAHHSNRNPNQAINELMKESADLPDLVQARLALAPIPDPNP